MLLNNRYQLQEPIGRGSMATIYRGFDTQMQRSVAIKVLREVFNRDPKFVRRFQKEAEVMYSLHHPNIVQVYDYGQTDGNYFIVMELIEGIDLRRYLRSRGILDSDNAVKIAHDVALGLGAAHSQSIVHRNVKPHNIMVGRIGPIKLIDFCLANVQGQKLHYSPEQVQGQIVNPVDDIYSLGIIVYEMVTGHVVFDGDSSVAGAMQHIYATPKPPSQFNPDIPTVLEEIIMRCLEKEPDIRFRDGTELARALEALM